MDKQNTISKHAKRRANKKAQKQETGGAPEKTEDNTREQQIKDLEYAAGEIKETKSNEEMKDEEPTKQEEKSEQIVASK